MGESTQIIRLTPPICEEKYWSFFLLFYVLSGMIRQNLKIEDFMDTAMDDAARIIRYKCISYDIIYARPASF